MAKVGRPRLTAQEHWHRGTYRPDRHGPLPSRPQAVSAHVPRGVRHYDGNAVAVLTGAALVAAIQATYEADDPLARVLLAAAGAAQDRRLALSALLDGSDGLLAQLAAGKAAMPAKAIEVLLKAEAQAADTFLTTIDRLHLDAVQPIGRHEVAS
jgi:hypothetical protein